MMERSMRGNSHVRFETGEKVEFISKNHLLLTDQVWNRVMVNRAEKRYIRYYMD